MAEYETQSNVQKIARNFAERRLWHENELFWSVFLYFTRVIATHYKQIETNFKSVAYFPAVANGDVNKFGVRYFRAFLAT